MDGRRWSINKIENEILKSRDIVNLDRFLYPIEEDMVPFEEFKNINSAANVVIDGIKNAKNFFVYGDVDCDGICSTAIITRYLMNFSNGGTVTPYINEGKKHGLDYAAPCFDKKYDIVIIVDAIEDSSTPYNTLLDMGSEIVVLDHHNLVPEVLAMQKRIHLVSSMNDYPNPNLCGAGVTLKFCLYLDTLMGTNYANDYYDFAACGICADMMSVGTDALENRFICKQGFDNVKNLAIIKLKGSYNMDATTVSFGIAPLVNAANRMNQNWDALKAFLSDDESEINQLIENLKGCREKQNKKVEEAYAKIEAQAESQKDKKVMFFVLDESDGISGLLANKALGQFQRPIIMTKETKDITGEETYMGSIRAAGVEDFSKLVNKTRYAKALGHSNAAGFSMQKKNKEKFSKKIEEALVGKEFEQHVNVDIQLSQRQICKELITWLKQLNRISGIGFPPVTVMIEDVTDYEVGYLSNGRHTKITTPYMLFIKWNCNDWEFISDEGSLSAYGTLDQGFFGKKFNYRMIMEDYKIDELLDLDEI